MVDALIFVLFIATLWILGQCLLHFVAPAENESAYSMAAGLTLVVLLVNYLYYMCNLSIASIRIALLGCLVAGTIFLLVRVWPKKRPEPGDLVRTVLLFLLLITPAIIGGEQYYVFRGNWWDHFTYISAAFGFANHTLEAVRSFNTSTVISNELLAFSEAHHTARPSVMLLFSLFLDGRGDIFFRAFLYTSSLLALAYPPLHCLCQLIREKGHASTRLVVSILPAAFILGFWGQYIFDINAWAHLGFTSLILAFVAAYITLLQRWSDNLNPRPPIAPYLLSILFFAGSWFFYPESALLHIIMVAASTVGWILLSRRTPVFGQALWLAAIPVASLLLALPNYETTIVFVTKALGNAVTSNSWWIYFDSFIVGIEPPFETFLMDLEGHGSLWEFWRSSWYVPFNSILSFFGFYFATPQGSGGFQWALWVALSIAASALLALGFLYNLTAEFKKSHSAITILRLLVIVALGALAYFLLNRQWWTAGKLLTYISPYIYLILVLPLLQVNGLHSRVAKLAGTAACAVVVLSLGFGAARVYSATDVNGIGYYKNYPSVQGVQNKSQIAWDLDLTGSDGCSVIDVDRTAGNAFFNHYVKTKLAYAGLEYYTTAPIKAYFGQDDVLGYMPAKPTDCAITLRVERDGKVHPSLIKKR